MVVIPKNRRFIIIIFLDVFELLAHLKNDNLYILIYRDFFLIY